jgi:hypothetical protein
MHPGQHGMPQLAMGSLCCDDDDAGVVWYTLKDAADRGRLAASTFKQLNLAMAVVAVLQLAAYGYMAAAGEQLVTALAYFAC